jgi:hypothetical protein
VSAVRQATLRLRSGQAFSKSARGGAPAGVEVKIPALSQKTRQGRGTLGVEMSERVGQPPEKSITLSDPLTGVLSAIACLRQQSR